MRAAFNDAAAFEHDDFVAIADRAQAVGDDDAGAASAPQVVVDGFFGDRIKCSRRFVQDKDRGIANQSSGDFDALTLTTAEIRTAFIDVAVIIARSAREVLMNQRVLGRRQQVALSVVESQSVRLSRAVPSNRKMSWST